MKKSIKISFDESELSAYKNYAWIKRRCSLQQFIKQLLNSEQQRHPLKRDSFDIRAYIDKTVAKHIKQLNHAGGALPCGEKGE